MVAKIVYWEALQAPADWLHPRGRRVKPLRAVCDAQDSLRSTGQNRCARVLDSRRLAAGTVLTTTRLKLVLPRAPMPWSTSFSDLRF
jgi:hypothetical protein